MKNSVIIKFSLPPEGPDTNPVKNSLPDQQQRKEKV